MSVTVTHPLQPPSPSGLPPQGEERRSNIQRGGLGGEAWFFISPELSGFFKNRFSAHRNSPVSSKTVFQLTGTLRFLQKPFFSSPELSDFFKNRFSSLRKFPQLPKIVFQACGSSRSSQKSFFKSAEVPAAPKNRFSSLRKFPLSLKTVPERG
jgi:hypothetical protein